MDAHHVVERKESKGILVGMGRKTTPLNCNIQAYLLRAQFSVGLELPGASESRNFLEEKDIGDVDYVWKTQCVRLARNVESQCTLCATVLLHDKNPPRCIGY